ncbi:helix-turn-helix domain-containing protein [Sphingomonas sp.]|uniref:winged helix-turn-helix transcriptional regulator n=1 Tax=Sphingomonas sp. TaxID=28214 RepID=UPI002BF2C77B|nr:helix-turn-helix domain-containing protein [Sphingomonas sp.]HWK34856.1 helix-turn-helix domain-containing protein [Sphingomonas sp.]
MTESGVDEKSAAHEGVAETGGHQLASNSARRALDIVGDRWTLMILHLAFTSVRRFEDFQSRIGLARSLLTDRLRRMEKAGVVRRERYQDRPPRDEYVLTPMGIDLFGSALMIIRWEKRWFYDPDVIVHRLRHSCGKVFMPELHCATCDIEVVARDVTAVDGPGAGFEPPQKPRAQRRSTVARGELDPHQKMLERAIEVLGDRWTAQTIASAFGGTRRFNALQAVLGVAPNILAERLSRLVELGVLARRRYQDKPERFEYVLTPEGLDLFPLILELIRWGDRWLAGDAGPPQIIRHRPCGTVLKTRIICDQCGETVSVVSTSFDAVSDPPAR